MTTSLLDRFETERLAERAHEVRFGETLLRLAASLFFAIGWIVAKVFSVTWLCFAFAGVAIAEGWREGRKNVRRPGG